MREAVVFLHGILMTGLELSVLRRRVRDCGFTVHQFNYHSVRLTPAQNAARLREFVRGLDADVVHFVAHSLGGIVVLHLFEQDPGLPPGEVLLLGTPVAGSSVARVFARSPMTRWLLGHSIVRGLLGDRPRWAGGRRLGMIAGTRGIGMGMLVGSALPDPNDGTVALAETRSVEIARHLSVPYGHFGMLWSPRVAEAVCHYLRHGEFPG
ncbi:MAG: alpha/beta hydrolase [Gammaproteobacteria bacterium]|jgi:pimeloyl-ACP methyl ester carboxylesterase